MRSRVLVAQPVVTGSWLVCCPEGNESPRAGCRISRRRPFVEVIFLGPLALGFHETRPAQPAPHHAVDPDDDRARATSLLERGLHVIELGLKMNDSHALEGPSGTTTTMIRRNDLQRAASPRGLPPAELAMLGRRIQERRVERGVTLDVLAQRTGFSKGYLSRIENGKKTPPLSTLGRIATALATDVHALLVAPLNHDGSPYFRVLRASERQPVERAESAFGYKYESLGAPSPLARMRPFIVQLPREIDRHVFFEHDGEEFVYLLQGKVEWQIGHERHVLQAGDGLSLDSRLPHRARAIEGDATALMVLLPRREMGQIKPAARTEGAAPQTDGSEA